MKKNLLGLIVLFVSVYGFAADGPVFSGVFNSTITVGAGTGGLPDFYWGLEEYANLRLKKQLGEHGSVYMAFNLIAAGGVSALALQTGAFGISTSGNSGDVNSNYAAAMELERLYVHLTGEKIAFDSGLMRLAFGYGNVFSPNDYFNPRNPLYPDARQRAVLGVNFSVYPTDMLHLQFFGVGPKDPFAIDGYGVSGGLSVENHWKKMSAQFLYSIEAAQRMPVHNFGVSLKADLPVGIIADILWTYPQEESASIEGLAASAGLDYTFSIATHTMYLLAEYLYKGDESKMTGYANHHYLYGEARFSIDDYMSVTAGALAGFETLSVVPLLSFTTDLFQGAAITLQAQVPCGEGELGPDATNRHFAFTTKLSIKL
ncbi:hypothetical protein AGMMS49940_02940 [Spirochaetia bacterium]|nr:hypothetical protein AGMMS49940_02940 [Spirochaetia bacterium]